MEKIKKNKKVSFRELSDIHCIDCGKPLKVNLVKRNPLANRCYVCHNIANGKFEITYHKLIRGTQERRIKVVKFKDKQKEQFKIYKYANSIKR